MLDRVQKYIVAVVAAVVAVIALIAVALSLTVWKPSQEVVSTTQASHELVMTRQGVLPLLASEVTVTVKAGATDRVAIVRGTPADIKGWLADTPYSEVVGIASGYKALVIEDHQDMPQSGVDGAQSVAPVTPAAPEQAQSGDTPQSAEVGTTLPEIMAANDMWVNVASGVGEANLRLTDLEGQAAVLVASSGETPTLTLTWPVQSRNYLLLISATIGALFGALAVLAALRQYMLERSRVARAQALEARRTADITDTTTLSVEEIAAYGEEQAKAEAQEETEESHEENGDHDEAQDTSSDDESAEEPAEAAHGDQPTKSEIRQDDAAGAEADTHTPMEKVRKTLTLVGLTAVDEADTQAKQTGFIAAANTVPQTDTASAEPTQAVSTEASELTESAESGAAEETRIAEELDAEHPSPVVEARHTSGQLASEETVSTDTGTIDLSSIRPGAILPSRRALREARERGESAVTIEGQSFDTGLIPQITRVDAQEIESLTEPAADGAQAKVEEYIFDNGTAEDTQKPTSGNGWSSMMSRWARRRQNEEGTDK